MKKLVLLFCLFFIVLLLGSQQIYAQGKYGLIGKVFTKVEADQLFGGVAKSYNFSKSDVKFALKHSSNYVLFYVKNGNVHVINGQAAKNKKYSTVAGITADFDVAYAFSKKVVEDFVNNSKSKVFSFEIRGASGNAFGKVVSVAASASGVATVSDGENVLEMSLVCPPICLYD
ncbi:MAG: hypothetical protein FJ214_04205 [Ignavibacteria bacterium]|nr:hypothetical protein [Ignavibacteria bacterium]